MIPEFISKRERLKKINFKLSNQNIWNNSKYAAFLMKKRSLLEIESKNLEKFIKKADYTVELFKLALEDKEESLLLELQQELILLKKEIEAIELSGLFSKKEDKNNCYIDIKSGSGGIDAQDWTSMLLRMYLRWANNHNFRTEIISESEGEISGIKSVTIKVIDRYAYGWCRTETGIHRLVRKSPFDSECRRHTSFSSVFVYPETKENLDIKINPSDLRIDVYRSSGAGGQHVNKTESAVRITHLPTNIVAECQSSRSQHKNKRQAMRYLISKLNKLNFQNKNFEKQILEDSKSDIRWGNQIRSYVLDNSHIKDLRTGLVTNNVRYVLDGNLDEFIKASLKAGL